LSKYGIVSTPNGVIYPSQNGLAIVGPGGLEVVTRNLITKNEWVNQYSPESLWGAQYEDAYIGFYSSGEGFIINPREPQNGFIQLTGYSDIAFVQTDYYNGDVLVVVGDTVYLWDDPSELREEFRWTSRTFTLPKPANLGAARIEMASATEALEDLGYPTADLNAWNEDRISYPLAELGGDVLGSSTPEDGVSETLPFKFDSPRQPLGGSPLLQTDYDLDNVLKVRFIVRACDCEGELREVFSEVIILDRCIRLPSGFKSDKWQFEIIGRRAIYHIKVAETCKGLEDV